MAKFMLILLGPPDVWPNLSPEEVQRKVEKYQAWVDGIRSAGRHVSSEKLADEGGRSLSRQNGKLKVVDGPYSEAKEVVAGYFVFHAENYDDAIQLVGNSPFLEDFRFELRQTDPNGCGGH